MNVVLNIWFQTIFRIMQRVLSNSQFHSLVFYFVSLTFKLKRDCGCCGCCEISCYGWKLYRCFIFIMSPGNVYTGKVWSTMDWWWMDRALILHSMLHKSILKHSKTYAKPAQLSYVAACPLSKNVRWVIFLQMHNII